MALKQQITSVSGATTEYHRISEATIDYTNRKAYITVLSYLEAEKRDEEKERALQDAKKAEIEKELYELVARYTTPEADPPEEKARRNELSKQLNDIPLLTPDDVAPRNLFTEQHTLEIPEDTEFSLEFAYNWLKENVYTEAEDC